MPPSTRAFVCLCPRPPPTFVRLLHHPVSSDARRPRSPASLQPHAKLLRLRRNAFCTAARLADREAPEQPDVAWYQMSFTCKVCAARSSHEVSQQGYHHGTVLVACPGCKNRHLISDHLKIFSDARVTLEDIMREKGQLVKRGRLDQDGHVELWDSASLT